VSGLRNERLGFDAEDEDRIAGFAVGAMRDRRDMDAYAVVPFRDGYVTELYVVSEGRNHGIGTTLVEACEPGSTTPAVRRFASRSSPTRA
jgi:ribosomal protein S18 acetylase RimI-like enzyme